MTRRLPVAPSPGPLGGYVARFYGLFRARTQREDFRHYLEGLLLPTERNKTLTPRQHRARSGGAAQGSPERLQWFLSEPGWNPEELNGRRIELLLEDPSTAPDGDGVLVLDEHGARKKWGKHTPHVGRQWLASGQDRQRRVSVSSLLVGVRAYYPLEVEPYTPAHHFRVRQDGPGFPHQAEDSRPTGAPFGRDGRALLGGGGGLLLRRGSGAQAFPGGVWGGLRSGAQERLPDQERPRDTPPLAVGVLRVFVLLVGPRRALAGFAGRACRTMGGRPTGRPGEKGQEGG